MINIDNRIIEQYLNKLSWKFYSSRSEFVCVYKIQHQNRPNAKINCIIGLSTSKDVIINYSCEFVTNDMDDAFRKVEAKRREFVNMLLQDIVEAKKKQKSA